MAWSEEGEKSSGGWDNYRTDTHPSRIRWRKFTAMPYQVWAVDPHTIVAEPDYRRTEGIDTDLYTYDKFSLIPQSTRDWLMLQLQPAAIALLPTRVYLVTYGKPRMMKITRFDLGGD